MFISGYKLESSLAATRVDRIKIVLAFENCTLNTASKNTKDNLINYIEL